jgi:hypothetical protein
MPRTLQLLAALVAARCDVGVCSWSFVNNTRLGDTESVVVVGCYD